MKTYRALLSEPVHLRLLSGRDSPNDLNGIPGQMEISTHQHCVFDESLSYKQAIKGIFVENGQGLQCEHMGEHEGKDLEAIGLALTFDDLFQR